MSVDYSTGFFKVPRAALAAIGADPITLAAYLTVCDRARWDGPGARNTARGAVRLDVGQCYVGREELAAMVGTTPRSIRTALDRLEALGLVRRETTNRGTTLTLVGYIETYGGAPAARPADDQQNDAPANDQQTTSRTTSNRPADDQHADDVTAEGRRVILSQGESDDQQTTSRRPAGAPQNDRETTTNGEERTETGERARSGSDPVLVPVDADPDREGGADLDRVPASAVRPLVNRFLTRINTARVDIAAKHKLGPARPVALMGQGGGGERDLLARLSTSTDPGGDLDHVLDVAIAEADATGEIRWLGWSLATEKAWRSRLLSTVAEVTRRKPKGRGAIGSAAPRNDHGTEARDCNEVFG